eukprot:gnl/MRDRNA2_/MRDRNA2_84782_c0_seq1.p1 gnl/MRDRNA2_/MRDRNA2_84782_c0~~gnl/MRDRNA2_/MRDRNA2_84782_c0_seq1.p1  ORF type:complete len:626 (+),score=141.81 gnl/MRDRNA2_/MRDRNA2_84782_c0_seq1:86-1963(+)
MAAEEPVQLEEEPLQVDWRKSPPEVKRMFEQDAKDGFYSKESFAELMMTIDASMDDDKVDAEFMIADESKNGKLSWNDFHNYFVSYKDLTEDSKDAVHVKGKLSDSAVFARVRPLAESGGHAAGEGGDFSFDGFDEKTNSITMSNRKRPKKFSFAKKVLSECTQQQMYDTMCTDLVNSCLMRSLDVMFLAYGQTGTGKTHTMFGPPESLDPETCPADGVHPEWGIFPRVFEYTRTTIVNAQETEMGSTMNCKLVLSALEFYMMGAFDLLNNQAPVFIDEGNPVGLVERECKTSKEMCEFLKEVYGNRHVRKTAMNEGSSRSHTALILKCYFCDSKDGDCVTSKFTLFDLAGAERTGKTGGKQMSPQDAMAAVYKGKDPGVGGEGAIINWDLTSLMNEVQKATDAAQKKRKYKCGTAMMTPAMQTICSCFDGRALLGMVVCMSQAPQHGSETWFSCEMGERLAALKSPVQARKIEKIEAVIKDRKTRLQKAEKSLKDKPGNKFAPTWTAQVQGLTLELSVLNELKQYDESKDQVNVFVRKKFGLYTPEEETEEEKEAKVRACFEKADANGDKVISKDEFMNIFTKLPKCDLLPEHIEALFKQIDTNNNGQLSFDEFFDYMYPKTGK